MMKYLGTVWITFMAALLIPAVAYAEPDPRLYQVREALQKHKSITKRQLLWISANARENLVNLASDRKESKVVRTRAIHALRYFTNKGTFRVLRTMIFDPIEPAAVRAAAMETLGYFNDPGVVGILKQFLLSAEPKFRLNAARGLAKQGSKEACSAILQALAKETVLSVKLKLDALSQECSKRNRGVK